MQGMMWGRFVGSVNNEMGSVAHHPERKSIEIPFAGSFRHQDERDRHNARRVVELLQTESRAFCSSTRGGHITASAFIIDTSREHVLLTHHAKLDCWLQLGGHCDGIRDPAFVARKEAYEESGLDCITPITHDLFDIDIHTIPAHGDMPEHLHFDLRYLFEANMSMPLQCTSESKALAWVSLSDLENYTQKSSVLIIKRKLESL
ncbi:MAG: NUDIX hydrolase [Paracoccaceae bacterium]